MYIGLCKPYVSRVKNNLEYFNEAMIGIITFYFFFYTEWIDSEEMKFNLGWILIIFVFALIIINLVFVFYYAIRQCYLIYLKYNNLYDQYKKK